MKKILILWDLDDTLVNSRHRSKFDDDQKIDVEHFIKNATPSLIEQDHLIHPMIELSHYFLNRSDCHNIVITSRSASISDINFLKMRGLHFDDFLYRGHPIMLHRLADVGILSDADLKEILLGNYLAKFPDFRLGFGFDDKKDNLDVFYKEGFTAVDAKSINHYTTKTCYVIEQFETQFGVGI